MVNIVCFVRFADEGEDVFAHSPEFYEKLYNDEGTDANSVLNYFSWVSYRQFKWKTLMFPQTGAENAIVLSYQDKLKRGQLRPYNATTNPEGYTSSTTATTMEHELVGRVAAYIDGVLPDSIKLDNYKEGTVDNLTIIYSGNSETSSSKGILWPHQDNILFSTYKIKGCRVPRYLAVFDTGNGTKSGKPVEINTGVLCHEMTHVLGAYDLYTSSTDTSNPVGTWDLMSDNNLVPQGLTAYMRWSVGGWIKNIPQITEDGVYTLRPVGSETNENVAYMIRTSKAASEYFIVEYRKKEGTFESGIPNTGLIVYRISTTASGNLGADKEVYIFRQNATANYKNAVMSADLGITEGNTSSSPFKYRFSNGTQCKFAITDVGTCGETITFHYTKDQTVDGIEEITDTQDGNTNAPAYNLAGQRVSSNAKGVIIRNGRIYRN